MPYATIDQLRQFGSAGATLAALPATDVNAALAAASSTADSYLRQRFTLPLTAWGDELTRAVCSLVAYDLLSNRGYDPGAGDNDNIRLRYDDALAWLKDVAKGTLSPEVTDSAEPPGIEDDGPVVYTNQRRGW